MEDLRRQLLITTFFITQAGTTAASTCTIATVAAGNTISDPGPLLALLCRYGTHTHTGFLFIYIYIINIYINKIRYIIYIIYMS